MLTCVMFPHSLRPCSTFGLLPLVSIEEHPVCCFTYMYIQKHPMEVDFRPAISPFPDLIATQAKGLLYTCDADTDEQRQHFVPAFAVLFRLCPTLLLILYAHTRCNFIIFITCTCTILGWETMPDSCQTRNGTQLWTCCQ